MKTARMTGRFGAVLLAATLAATAAGASAWAVAKRHGEAGWRTDGTGRYPAARPPLSWSPTENVVWKHPLAAWSNATPVLHRGLVFTLEEPSTLVCLEQATGEERWRAEVPFQEFGDAAPAALARKERELGALVGRLRAEVTALGRKVRAAGADPEARKSLTDAQARMRGALAEKGAVDRELRRFRPPVTHTTNGYTSPTPVAAGDRVWVLFGTGVAAAFDLEGRRLWARVVGKPSNSWGHSASPLLVDGRLVVHIGRAVLALDPETGDGLWEAASGSWWGTPFAFAVGGEWAIVTTGGAVVRCRDGRVVSTQIGAIPWTSPLVADGVIYVVDQKGATAWRLPPKLGDQVVLEQLWKTTVPPDRYYASPLLHEGLLYAMTQTSHMTVLEAATGEIVYQRKLGLGGTAYPSFCLAGGMVFASAESGTTSVFEPGREYREVARNRLEAFRCTPVFDGARIYVRGLRHLWCLGAA